MSIRVRTLKKPLKNKYFYFGFLNKKNVVFLLHQMVFCYSLGRVSINIDLFFLIVRNCQIERDIVVFLLIHYRYLFSISNNLCYVSYNRHRKKLISIMVVSSAFFLCYPRGNVYLRKHKVMIKNSFTPDLFKQWISFEKNRVHNHRPSQKKK